MPELPFMAAAELSPLLDDGSVGSGELTRAYLERIERLGPALNCFVMPLRESALAEAAQADARAVRKQRRGPLDGIPVALKDNIDVAGLPTSNGFGGKPYRVPEEDAAAVRRLREAGAVILGKLNMEEGALGPASNNPHFGPVINPYRPGYSPGGSSGGSGAAVAAGLCCAALGTDTGGSIRIPASYCGVVGLKASFGAISTRGVVPLCYGLDHIGPLTRSVADAALFYSALKGFDPQSPESRPAPDQAIGPWDARSGLQGVTIGVLQNYEQEPPQPEVASAFQAALDQLAALGARIRSVALPSYDMLRGRRAGFLRCEAEAAFVHGDLYRREPERFSPLMHGYLDYGLKASAQQLLRADRVIAIAACELGRAFEEVDLIVSPTTPQPAFPFGPKFPDTAGTYTILANFAGAPAVSVPMGGSSDGLPLGLQFMAPVHGEAILFRAAAAYEGAARIRVTPPAPFGALAPAA